MNKVDSSGVMTMPLGKPPDVPCKALNPPSEFQNHTCPESLPAAPVLSNSSKGVLELYISVA